MSVTVQIVGNDDIRVSTDTVEPHPPDAISFTVEGTITITEALLGQFEGTTLEPVAVDLAVDDSECVTVDLRDDGRLRLETIDIGVEPPDVGDLIPDGDTVRSPIESATELPESEPGVIAFTVEGVVEGISAAAIDDLSRSDRPLAVESITFALEESVRGDGGREDDIVAEFTLLGYGIVVRRNGTVAVGLRRGSVDE